MIKFDASEEEADVTCDTCGDVVHYTRCNDFKHAVQKAKEDDFQIVKDGDEWQHHCFMCSLG